MPAPVQQTGATDTAAAVASFLSGHVQDACTTPIHHNSVKKPSRSRMERETNSTTTCARLNCSFGLPTTEHCSPFSWLQRIDQHHIYMYLSPDTVPDTDISKKIFCTCSAVQKLSALHTRYIRGRQPRASCVSCLVRYRLFQQQRLCCVPHLCAVDARCKRKARIFNEMTGNCWLAKIKGARASMCVAWPLPLRFGGRT